MPIYHLVRAAGLRAGLDAASYRPADLASEGFVHCAREESALAVADDYFGEESAGEGALLLLRIDPHRLSCETRTEAPAPRPGAPTAHLATAESFPHVYGAIDRDAITGVGVLERGPGGGYRWPGEFATLDAFLSGAVR